jgi:high-affinity nickel permease
MDATLTTALGLGLLLGLRHATDADHVAAVSTLVSQHKSVVRSCVLGAFWGAGHTLALLAAGVGVIAFKLTFRPTSSRASSGRWPSS